MINYGQATRPWILLPVGLVYAAVYYGLFRFFIQRFDLKTPGREAITEGVGQPAADASPTPVGGRAEGFVTAVGGARNIQSVPACTTRLRLVICDRSLVDEAALKSLGARGVIFPSLTDLQVILGPIADGVADEIKAWLALGHDQPRRDPRAVDPDAGPPVEDGRILDALGGRDNILSQTARSGRVCLTVRRGGLVDRDALQQAAPRGVAFVDEVRIHILTEPLSAASLG